MKNSNTHSETNNGTISTPQPKKGQNAEVTLKKIRQVIEDNHKDKNNQSEYPSSISDKIIEKIRVFDMVLKGVHYTVHSGMSYSEEDHHGVHTAWLEIRELLEKRDEEHLEIYKLATQGTK